MRYRFDIDIWIIVQSTRLTMSIFFIIFLKQKIKHILLWNQIVSLIMFASIFFTGFDFLVCTKAVLEILKEVNSSCYFCQKHLGLNLILRILGLLSETRLGMTECQKKDVWFFYSRNMHFTANNENTMRFVESDWSWAKSFCCCCKNVKRN